LKSIAEAEGDGPRNVAPKPIFRYLREVPETHPLLGKTTVALGVMLTLLAIPYASPRLRAYRVTRAPWDTTSSETTTTSETIAAVTAPTPTLGDQSLHASENQGTVTNALPAEKTDPVLLAETAGSLAVEDPVLQDGKTHALDAFYRSLARTDKKEPGAVTRILHYGDSVITGDLVSGTMRRKMQARFGDAGHGFILTANPWEWYFHNDVAHSASDGWNANRITGPWTNDGFYGVGGVSFHTAQVASAWFGTPGKGDYGRNVSRFDVYYLEQPQGGDVDLIVPGRPAEVLSTRGSSKVSRVHLVSVPDGAAHLTIKTRGSGDVRVFGVALERDQPGVVYDALGANGARARLWEPMNAGHWKDQMALRNPALVVLQYGTNESEDNVVDPAVYAKQLGALIEKVKQAAPDASILVAAPLDRAEKGEGGRLKTRKIIVELVALQKQIAAQHGVAFWNTFEAMGGNGAIARWVKASPQLASGDLTHPTPAGAELLGDLFYKALTTGYAAASAKR
jgi:lysophospholipase L1-like esterase